MISFLRVVSYSSLVSLSQIVITGFSAAFLLYLLGSDRRDDSLIQLCASVAPVTQKTYDCRIACRKGTRVRTGQTGVGGMEHTDNIERETLLSQDISSLSRLFKTFIFILCVCESFALLNVCACINVCASMCMPGALGDQWRASDTPKVELQVIVSCHLSTRN